MSILRSIMFEKWPYIDRYGVGESNHVVEIHVANAGFDSGLIHIALHEVKIDTNEYVSSCEGNFNISQTKQILTALQKLIYQYEVQQEGS